MLVYFTLGDAKVWRWGSKPTPVPDVDGFASQWNIGIIIMSFFNMNIYKYFHNDQSIHLILNGTQSRQTKLIKNYIKHIYIERPISC